MGLEDRDFLGFSCAAVGDLATGVCRVSIEEPYKYSVIFDSSTINSNEYQQKSLKQGLTSCVKKSIELSKSGLTAFWFSKNEENSLDKYIRSNKLDPNIIVKCSFEEYLNIPVSQSSKPIDLLRKISKKLYNKGLLAEYTLTAMDFIECNIPIEPLCIGGKISKFSRSREGESLLAYLEEQKYIKRFNKTEDSPVELTLEGWEYLEKNNLTQNNTVFIAMSFTDWPADSNEKGRVIQAIQQACKKLNLEANPVSQDHTGYITDKIIAEIKSAKFVVADFTYNNRGVYYEAALARGLGKPVYHLVKKGHTDGQEENKKLHFDIKQILYREWESPEDIEEILFNWIKADA